MVHSAVLCLAMAVYGEARGESAQGQRAVAEVVLTRAHHQAHLVCKVVRQPKQFNGVYRPQRTHGTARNSPEQKAWRTAQRIARRALAQRSKSRFTHYHSVKVHPRWAHKLRYVTTIGKHKFYYSAPVRSKLTGSRLYASR